MPTGFEDKSTERSRSNEPQQSFETVGVPTPSDWSAVARSIKQEALETWYACERGRQYLTQTKAYEPNILVDTSDLPRDEWLKYRRLGIGGSDAAAILGISPFRTARDLYYDKLNIVTADDEGNWVAMEMGNLLEPLVARIFAKKTGLKVFQRKCMFQHPHYPWMLADLDYLVELPDGSIAILEIKTSATRS